MLKKLLFVLLCVQNIFGAPWTVNLKPAPSVEIRDYNYIRNGDVVYDNNGGNSDVADDEYHSFFEKKIAKIIYNGGVYLDGLRKSLQNYADKFSNCTKNFRDFNNSNVTNSTTSDDYKKCQEAVTERERVRRVAQLAVITTREIQDRIITNNDDEFENKNLLLRLAWLLDKLAHMTGFEPKPEDYLTTDSPKPLQMTPKEIPREFVTDGNVTDDRKMMMIKCLDKDNNDTRAAFERCPDDAPMIPSIRAMFNNSTQKPNSQPTSTNSNGPNANVETQDGGVVRSRRAIHEHGEKIISRIPEDPLQDISGYVKSKPGTTVQNSPVQTEQLRLYMLYAFQNPNIVITRRYGSNYNPAIPNPFYGGIVRSGADI